MKKKSTTFNVNVQTVLIGLVLTQAITGCGELGTVPATQIKDAPLSYADVAPIIATNCMTCHGSASTHVHLTTEAEVNVARERALAALQSGRMPFRRPTWKDTDDGKKLAQWLAIVSAP